MTFVSPFPLCTLWRKVTLCSLCFASCLYICWDSSAGGGEVHHLLFIYPVIDVSAGMYRSLLIMARRCFIMLLKLSWLLGALATGSHIRVRGRGTLFCYFLFHCFSFWHCWTLLPCIFPALVSINPFPMLFIQNRTGKKGLSTVSSLFWGCQCF